MTLQDFADAIMELDIPSVYGYYTDDKAPPYIAYRATEKNCIYADGIVVYSEEWMVLEYVSRNRDLNTERALEMFLTVSKIPFSAPECFFDEKQKIHITQYEFQLE